MKVNQNRQPMLRFPGFEDDWKLEILKNSSKFFSGGTPKSTNRNFYSGNIPFIGSGNINDSSVNQFITEEALKSSSAKMVNQGDLLYALYGATSGEVALSKIKGAINQAVLCIRTDHNSSFLYYLLNKSQNRIITKFLQGGQGNLSAKIIKDLKFLFPSIEEQQKIATFLSSVDNKLEQLQKKKDLLEQYKKGMMQKIFKQEIRFKDDNGKDFPEWKEMRLGKIGEIISGLTYSPDDINEEGIIVLRSSNIRKRRINLCDQVKVKVDKFNPVFKDDILICVRNGSKRLIGKNALINKESEGLAFGAFMTVFRSDSNLFLFHLFSSDIYRKQVYQNLGATINSINGSDLKKFKIPFPSKEEQTKIADFLSTIDQKINFVAIEIDKAKQFKKGLLQQMFV